ncbi:hypothetical protein [Anoxynatronum buryatiense]|uniref:Uncharacterized protein n=1 Tax=Anoxynatronum buryatiense TaxID=489973 RepID=A0AA46AKM5_9CLOT|nr:hypothetical protein [Anoxynatronum buryatiense]SMP72471.1 hypothetical protein SAMN06296020_1297 [Anoxynatronum buryatiense]
MANTKNFKSLDALKPVVTIVNEAGEAAKDKRRTIANSSIPNVLGGVLGAGAGGAVSFAALYGLGVAGVGAAGITSGLVTAGTIIGGGMVSGVFVLAAPLAGMTAAGVGIAGAKKRKQLQQEKERLLKAAIEKHHAIVASLKEEVKITKERAEYLNSLNILLQQAIKDLQDDL